MSCAKFAGNKYFVSIPLYPYCDSRVLGNNLESCRRHKNMAHYLSLSNMFNDQLIILST